jgi:hypothetical protein
MVSWLKKSNNSIEFVLFLVILFIISIATYVIREKIKKILPPIICRVLRSCWPVAEVLMGNYQRSWLHIPRSRVRFQELRDFLRGNGSRPGSIQPREDNWGATLMKSSGSCLEMEINGRGGPLPWPRNNLYLQTLALSSPISGGRYVGIVRLRSNSHGVCFICWVWQFSWVRFDAGTNVAFARG